MEQIISSLFGPILALYIIHIKGKYNCIHRKEYLIFFIGGIIFFTFSIFVEYFLNKVSENIFYESFIVASLTEEGIRFLVASTIIDKFKNDDVDKFKIIFIFISISAVFALFENFIYSNLYYAPIGIEVAYLRMYFSLPVHLLLGLIMGAFFYQYKVSSKYKFLVIAIFIPFLFHGFYNYLCSIDEMFYVILAIIAFIIVFKREVNYFIKS